MYVYINDKYTCSSEAVYGIPTDSDTKMKDGHSHKGESTAAKPASSSSSASIKTISHMTTCVGPIPVKKGDTMKLVAVYDLSKHPLRQSASGGKAADVMGMLGVSFSADKK